MSKRVVAIVAAQVTATASNAHGDHQGQESRCASSSFVTAEEMQEIPTAFQ
jgi:hypothetical protein